MSLQADHAQLALDPAESTARPAVKPAARPSESHTMLHAAQSLLYIIIVAIFIITFAVQPFRIPSESMEPTLMVGDFLLVAKQDFPVPTDALPLPSTPIRRGDVVVFHYPIDPSIHLVKRVIGMPGDHLRLRDGRVFINGRALNEPYAVYRPGPSDNFRDNFPRLSNPDPDVTSNWWIQMKSLVNHGELTVPPRSFFVLGDNRNDSEDSRYWGFVPRNAIVGKPLVIYFSWRQPGSEDGRSAMHPDPLSGSAAASFARWNRTFRVVR